MHRCLKVLGQRVKF